MRQTLEKDLAIRIANICSVMDLDDEDEDLLWRYLASTKGDAVPSEITDVLGRLGSFSPVMLHCYKWSAFISDRFYGKRRRALSRLGLGLKRSGSANFTRSGTYVRSIDEYQEQLLSTLRRETFDKWKDELTACLREDGVNWEPPTDNDVEISLTVQYFELRHYL